MTLEGEWRKLGAGPQSEALGQAQDLVYEAWEAADGRSRYALARRALKISPLCADAWLILAERPSLSGQDRREFLERAVKAGELALGEDGFAEYEGHFWGFLETRPYMRARHSLAENRWKSGDHEAAIGHLRAMLDLNPGDNQGLRYVLLAWLLNMRDDTAAEELLRAHSDEASAFICYTQALFAFRKAGDGKTARKAAVAAWKCNRHVPKLLTQKGGVRFEDSGYYTLGGEDEAAYYIEEYGFAWKETPGAVDWLVEVTKELNPRRRGDATLH
ncbi:hypothetical protein [Paracoccus jeotgali]|uniref:hypothetical protein n=1 Tax=Paracoccus jeotgali TaxID=2065379 RepID=UPI0028B1EA36|nr:hypothetical protein [Paracoccus jeotgali]